MKGRLTVTGANLVFLTFAMLYLVWQVILTILSAIYGDNFIESRVYSILLVNQFVIILVPVMLYILVKGLNFKSVLRFNKLDWRAGLLIIVLAVPANFAASMLNSFVIYLLQFIGDIPRQPIPVPKNIAELVTGILMIAAAPAICEEMLHRGVLLRAYEARGSFKAIVITSVFFGFFHFDITNLLGPIFLGLLIGYYVIRTNSIFAGMLAHFMNNAFSELLQYLVRNEDIPKRVVVTTADLGGIIVWGIISLVLIWLLLKVFNYATEGIYRPRPPISSVRKDTLSIISHWPIIIILVIYICLTALFLASIIMERIH